MTFLKYSVKNRDENILNDDFKKKSYLFMLL